MSDYIPGEIETLLGRIERLETELNGAIATMAAIVHKYGDTIVLEDLDLVSAPNTLTCTDSPGKRTLTTKGENNGRRV